MTGRVAVAPAGAIGDWLQSSALHHRGGLNLARLTSWSSRSTAGASSGKRRRTCMHASVREISLRQAPGKPGAETGQRHAIDVLLAPILWGPRRPANWDRSQRRNAPCGRPGSWRWRAP